jgi:hypothetical protein
MIQALIGQVMPTPTARQEFLFYNDKFNTVLVVLLVILVAIFVWLFLTGRKLGKMERQIAQLESRKEQNGPQAGLKP